MGDKQTDHRTAHGLLADVSVRRYLLLSLGLGCMIGYVQLVAPGIDLALDGSAGSKDAWYALQIFAAIGAWAALALAGWKHLSAIGWAALSIIALVAAACPVMGAMLNAEGARVVTSILTGVSSAVLVYVWVMLLSSHGKRDLAAIAGTGIAVSVVVVIVSMSLGASARPIVGGCCAICAGGAALAADPRGITRGADGPLSLRDIQSLPLFTIITIAVVVFVAAFAFAVADQLAWLYDWRPNYFVFVISAGAILVSTFGMMLTRDEWMDEIWAPQLAVLVFGLALSCISLRESMQGAMGFLLASVFCAPLFGITVIPAMASDVKAPKASLSALLLLAMENSLGTMAGNAAGKIMPHSIQNLGGVAGLAAIVLFAAIAGAWVLIQRGRERRRDDADSRQVTSETLDDRIGRLSGEYGLTPRETEVAMLTAQGFSASYIAEKLVVSNSTVRFHQQNLYRKLEVHSKNEFIEFVSS